MLDGKFRNPSLIIVKDTFYVSLSDDPPRCTTGLPTLGYQTGFIVFVCEGAGDVTAEGKQYL